jgi:hypothetical protein
MRIKNIFLLFTLFPLLTFGQFLEKKIYNIEKVQSPPKIDGELNDKVWNKLPKAGNFTQIQPNNGESER